MHQIRDEANQYSASTAYQGTTDRNSPGKRHLPIAAKQMVYNEWGAILQH